MYVKVDLPTEEPDIIKVLFAGLPTNVIPAESVNPIVAIYD